jgi:hypothetical protein
MYMVSSTMEAAWLADVVLQLTQSERLITLNGLQIKDTQLPNATMESAYVMG